MWISDAIGDGLIQPSRAAHHSGDTNVAIDWLTRHYDLIPEHLRPPRRNVDAFASFFSTFLISSFDVIERPGMRGEGPVSSFGCRCEICLRIVNAPHLQVKKLYARDKRRAEFLMVESVLELASERQLEVDVQEAEGVVRNDAMRRHSAYVAYGKWLIRRLDGQSDGPAILALWRLIAWDPRGGMRRGFQLTLNDFRIAEEAIVERLVSLS